MRSTIDPRESMLLEAVKGPASERTGFGDKIKTPPATPDEDGVPSVEEMQWWLWLISIRSVERDVFDLAVKVFVDFILIRGRTVRQFTLVGDRVERQVNRSIDAIIDEARRLAEAFCSSLVSVAEKVLPAGLATAGAALGLAVARSPTLTELVRQQLVSSGYDDTATALLILITCLNKSKSQVEAQCREVAATALNERPDRTKHHFVEFKGSTPVFFYDWAEWPTINGTPAFPPDVIYYGNVVTSRASHTSKVAGPPIQISSSGASFVYLDVGQWGGGGRGGSPIPGYASINSPRRDFALVYRGIAVMCSFQLNQPGGQNGSVKNSLTGSAAAFASSDEIAVLDKLLDHLRAHGGGEGGGPRKVWITRAVVSRSISTATAAPSAEQGQDEIFVFLGDLHLPIVANSAIAKKSGSSDPNLSLPQMGRFDVGDAIYRSMVEAPTWWEDTIAKVSLAAGVGMVLAPVAGAVSGTADVVTDPKSVYQRDRGAGVSWPLAAMDALGAAQTASVDSLIDFDVTGSLMYSAGVVGVDALAAGTAFVTAQAYASQSPRPGEIHCFDAQAWLANYYRGDIFEEAHHDLEDFVDALGSYNATAPAGTPKVHVVQLGDMFDLWIGLLCHFAPVPMPSVPVPAFAAAVQESMTFQAPAAHDVIKYWTDRVLSQPLGRAVKKLLGFSGARDFLYGNHDNYLARSTMRSTSLKTSLGYYNGHRIEHKPHFATSRIYAEHGHQPDDFNKDGSQKGWAMTQACFRVAQVRPMVPNARVMQMQRAVDLYLMQAGAAPFAFYVMGHTHIPALCSIHLDHLKNTPM